VIALIFSFEQDPAVQTVLFVVLFVLFLITHLVMAPFRAAEGNVVETVGLSVLVVTALSFVRSGTLIEAGVVPPTGTAAYDVSKNLDVVVQVLFFVPLGITLIVVIWGIIAHRKKRLQSFETVVSKGLQRTSDWMLQQRQKPEEEKGLELSRMETATSGEQEDPLSESPRMDRQLLLLESRARDAELALSVTAEELRSRETEWREQKAAFQTREAALLAALQEAEQMLARKAKDRATADDREIHPE
jgi:hypothetical protein